MTAAQWDRKSKIIIIITITIMTILIIIIIIILIITITGSLEFLRVPGFEGMLDFFQFPLFQNFQISPHFRAHWLSHCLIFQKCMDVLELPGIPEFSNYLVFTDFH